MFAIVAAQRPGAGPETRTRALVLLFGLALVVRIGAALRTATIFNDGPSYLQVAAQMAAGEWGLALAHPYHPLYPFLTAVASFGLGDLERAGVAVSILCGSGSVLVLYTFLRHAWDERTAWIGASLLAVQPYAAEFSADVQSEGTYFLLFLAALACAWRSLSRASLPLAAAAGVVTGLAYLTRPEGLGVLLPAAVLASLRLGRGEWSLARTSRWGAALALGLVVIAAPYVVHLHGLTGHWVLSQKKSISDLLKPSEPPGMRAPGVPDRERWRPPSPGRRVPPQAAALLPASFFAAAAAGGSGASGDGSILVELLATAGSAFHPALVFLLAVGLYRARGRPTDRGVFLGTLVAAYAIVLYGLATNVGYLDRRHVLAPLLPLMGYAAAGVPTVGGWLLRLLPAGRRTPRTAVWACLGLVLAVTLPKTWSQHREEELAARRAAEWLRSRPELSGPVAADKHRTAYYAGEDFVHLDRGGQPVDVARLRTAGARFLIVDESRLHELQATGGIEHARELHRSEACGRRAWVYDLAGLDAG